MGPTSKGGEKRKGGRTEKGKEGEEGKGTRNLHYTSGYGDCSIILFLYTYCWLFWSSVYVCFYLCCQINLICVVVTSSPIAIDNFVIDDFGFSRFGDTLRFVPDFCSRRITYSMCFCFDS